MRESRKGLGGDWRRLTRPDTVAAVVFALSLAAYLSTLAPTFGFVDAGELAAAACTLGIAHPTGYPTLMVLGYVWTHVLPLRDVVALNILAAVLTALGAVALTLLLCDVMKRVGSANAPAEVVGTKKERARRDSLGPDREGPPGQGRWIPVYGGSAALATALTTTWWSQGVSFEVYCLHALLMPLVVLLFLRFVDEASVAGGAGAQGSSNRGAWFAWSLGLAFTNHLTTVLLVPALLVTVLGSLGLNRHFLLRLLRLAPWLIVGLAPYVWLPLRARMEPAFNWGDPATWKTFVDHVSAKQYRVWMFANPETFEQQTTYFLTHLPAELGYVGLGVVILGLIELGRRARALTVLCVSSLTVGTAYLLTSAAIWGIAPYGVLVIGTASMGLALTDRKAAPGAKIQLLVSLLLLTCLGYAGGYDIMEIRPYYLTAFLALGILLAVGMMAVDRHLGRRVGLATAAMVVLFTGLSNVGASDESDHTAVEDMTRNMLETLPDGALVLTAQWDFWVSGSWYLQVVEGVRPDVVVVDYELMRRSWYLDQLERAHPELMAKVAPETRRFRPHLERFEHNMPYDRAAIGSAYGDLLDALIDASMDERPVFVTGEAGPELGARYARVPYHLALRLVAEDRYLPQELPDYRFRPWRGPVSVYSAKLLELYARSLFARSMYESYHGNTELARRYHELASGFDPGWTLANLPAQPLDGRQRVEASLRFFEDLRAWGGEVASPES